MSYVHSNMHVHILLKEKSSWKLPTYFIAEFIFHVSSGLFFLSFVE